MHPNRRGFLRAGAVSVVAPLAGCSSPDRLAVEITNNREKPHEVRVRISNAERDELMFDWTKTVGPEDDPRVAAFKLPKDTTEYLADVSMANGFEKQRTFWAGGGTGTRALWVNLQNDGTVSVGVTQM